MKISAAAAAALLCWLLEGCAGDVPICSAGATVSCLCADGRAGTQACNSAGTGYRACSCSSGGGGGGSVCTPGERDDCRTSAGALGERVCASDGSGFGPCVCTPSCGGRRCGSDGCGGECGRCGRNQSCSGGDCVIDPAALWTLTVTTGTVAERSPSGEAWDPFGGLPDAEVCLTVSGVRRCSGSSDDTTTPAWFWRVGTFSTTALRTGLPFEFHDADNFGAAPICGPGTLVVRDEQFVAGRGTAFCTYGTFTFTVTP